MTPAQLMTARSALGLSARELAKALGYGGKRAGKHAGNDILRMEYGQRKIPQRVVDGLLALMREKRLETGRQIQFLKTISTPEVTAHLSERTGATHSEKRTPAGPICPPEEACDREGCHNRATHITHMGLQYCDIHP